MRLFRRIGYTVSLSLIAAGFFLGEIFRHRSGGKIGAILILAGSVVMIAVALHRWQHQPRPALSWENRQVQVFAYAVIPVIVGLYLVSRSHHVQAYDSYYLFTGGIVVGVFTLVFSGHWAQWVPGLKKKKSKKKDD